MPVKTRIIDIGWLFKNKKTFVDFVSALSECQIDRVFGSLLTTTLLTVFWEPYQSKLIKRLMIPYLLYEFTSVLMIIAATKQGSEEKTWEDYLMICSLAIASLVQWSYQF